MSQPLRLIVLAAVAGVAAGLAFAHFAQDGAARPITPRGELLPEEKVITELFKQASPSVVHITRSVEQRDFSGFNVTEVPEGMGSGFIWNDKGYVVTNFHVVQGAEILRVTLSDTTTWDAKLVGAAPDKDLAVVKIEAPAASLKPIPLGTSRDLLVGQLVLAIGNPFGVGKTLTTGIVSALGRQIQSRTNRPINGVIQTDAAVNPGNSGGPLLDSAGRLIGVNTAILAPTGTSAGIGFAVPADVVNFVVPQLIRNGRIERPGLGMQLVDDSIVKEVGVKGLLVSQVSAGSSAARAGLRPTTFDRRGGLFLGDVIVAIDGQPIETQDDYFRAVETRKPGDKVKLTVLRDRKRVEIEATLQDIPG